MVGSEPQGPFGQATRVVFRDVDDAEYSRLAGESEAAMPRRIGGFDVVRRIGAGGMGTVYEARQERPERTVALKVMRAGLGSRSLLTRFEREADILARLSHSSIAKVFAVGTHRPVAGEPGHEVGPVPFIALEYVPGARSITEYARAEGLDREARIRLVETVCDAIDHGHREGVLHRDLKPDNVLVDSEGHPKIIDFGVARVTTVASDTSAPLLTEYGQILGTVQYMSPEQCAANPLLLDARSDVYSLGVILYELVTGTLPYDVRELPVHEAIRTVAETVPPAPSKLDPTIDRDLDTILRKAIAKLPEDRYPTARALAEDLVRWRSGEPIAARPISGAQRLRRFAKKNPALASVLAVLCLVVAISATAIASLHSLVTREREARVAAERVADEHLRHAAAAEDEARALRDELRGVLSAGEADARLAGSPWLEDAARRLESLTPVAAADAIATVRVAEGFEALGDVLERNGANGDERSRDAWAKSLELRRAAIAKDGDAVLGAVAPRARAIVLRRFTAGAPAFTWRVTQREGELLLKLGQRSEAKVALRTAAESCARAFSEGALDPDVQADLIELCESLARLHREDGDDDAAEFVLAQCDAIREGEPIERAFSRAAKRD
jgi:hypothetical protein